MKNLICVTASLCASLVSSAAWATAPATETSASDAQPASSQAEASSEQRGAPEADTTYGHARQFGVRVGFVAGYNMIFRYNQSPFCAKFDNSKQLKDQQTFCGHSAPPALDVAVSFAPLGFVEPYVFGRFGLSGESETDTKPFAALGAGARIYTMSDSAFKIFVDPAIAYEFEGGQGTPAFQANSPQYKADILFHLAAGPQLDLARYVGIFADAGLTTGILRSIHSELELQLGVQARFP